MKSVSATSIKQHQGCKLQWYLQRVEGWEMPPSASQELGTAIHSQMEDWLLTGKEPEHPSAKYATRAFFNYEGPWERIVEEPKDFDMRMTAAGVPVKGRIDLMLRPVGPRPLVVLDWKTSSNLKYAMTTDQLNRDVQGVLYLKYAKESGVWAPDKHASFVHFYILTKGTGSKDVCSDAVTHEDVDRQWKHVEAEVERMKATASTPVASVPGNLQHCDKYGGCAFRDRCPAVVQLGPFASLGQGVEDMSKLGDILKARKAALGVVPPDATVPAPVEVKADPVLPTPPVKVEDTPEAWVVASAPAPYVPAPEPVEERPKSIVEVTYSRPTAPAEGLVLYVDCAPDGGGYGILEREIAERTPSLLEHLRKTAPKDVPEGAVDLGEALFGRGYAALAASFVVRPLTGKWVVNSQFPASSRVLEVLTPKAVEIVRGRR